MKPKIFFSILILLIAINLAFQLEVMDEWPDNAKEYFRENVEKYQNRIMEKCRDEARAKAALMVDSVMTGKKILISVDTFERPFRPVKPEKPEFRFEVDTSKPDKLFEE